MTCTRCGSSDVNRSSRRGACDEIQSWFGRYPYRCSACGLRFRMTGRYRDRDRSSTRSASRPSERAQHQTPKPTPASSGPEMAFRAHAEKPQAKIVVQAETHEQLNHILLTLDKAISSYGKSAKPENSRPSYASR